MASGSVMRLIGRLLSEASPVNVAEIGWPATAPIKSLTPVPAFPKSSGASGGIKPPVPTPSIVIMPASEVMFTPSARTASSVDNTSAPINKPATFVWPMAIPPKISARCDIDLSPGISISPDRPEMGEDVRVSMCVFISKGWARTPIQVRKTSYFLGLLSYTVFSYFANRQGGIF